jgi:hypothetical protein
LQITGNAEKFTATIAFDTHKLYGVVKGSREITISPK